jgi:hypothetical protein
MDGTEPRTIKISKSGFINVPVEEILASSEFTVLEFTPEAALPEYAPFLNGTNGFYLVDQFSRKAVFQFDQQGKFIRTIGNSGQGPGEYTQIKDALIGKNGVEILSGNTTTEIYQYNSDGGFRQKLTAPVSSVYSFARLPGTGDYLLFSGFSRHLVHRLDAETLAPLDSFLIRNQNLMTPGVQAFGPSSPASVLFYQPYDNRIFRIGKDTIHTAYIFDTGSLMPAYDDLTAADQNKLFGDGVLWLVYKAMENKDWLYLLLSSQDFANPEKSDFYSLLFNRKSGKLYRLPENPEPGPLFLPAFGLDEDNVLYTAVSPAYMYGQPAWKAGLGEKGIQENPDGNYIIIRISLDFIKSPD